MNQEPLTVLREILHTLILVKSHELDNSEIVRLESAIKNITKLIDGDNYPDTNEPAPITGCWSCEGIDENLAKQVAAMKKAMGRRREQFTNKY